MHSHAIRGDNGFGLRSTTGINYTVSWSAGSLPARDPIRPDSRLTTIVLLAGFAAACGGSDDDTASEGETRTIEVEMRDIAFSPERVEVDAGETVRFVFPNEGEAVHDAYIGDTRAQDQHEMDMRERDDDEHGAMDDDEDAITVDPGETGELSHTFREAGTILIGCHQPGHYAAGMKLTVEIG